MLKIAEISSAESFETARQKEKTHNDYLYILKYCNQIKMSDNGTLKNLTNVMVCNSQEEYDSIAEKENIVYAVKTSETNCKLYFGTTAITSESGEGGETYTDEEVNAAIDEILAD